jgi:hypothetical protein
LKKSKQIDQDLKKNLNQSVKGWKFEENVNIKEQNSGLS